MLDLSAAFESADHSILLQSLEHVIGTTGTVLGWVSSYLSDRVLLVFVHDVSFRHTNISHGVSRGSVLLPIHFSFCTLSLGKCIIWQNNQISSSFKWDKSEAIVVGPKRLWNIPTDHIIFIVLSVKGAISFLLSRAKCVLVAVSLKTPTDRQIEKSRLLWDAIMR